MKSKRCAQWTFKSVILFDKPAKFFRFLYVFKCPKNRSFRPLCLALHRFYGKVRNSSFRGLERAASIWWSHVFPYPRCQWQCTTFSRGTVISANKELMQFSAVWVPMLAKDWSIRNRICLCFSSLTFMLKNEPRKYAQKYASKELLCSFPVNGKEVPRKSSSIPTEFTETPYRTPLRENRSPPKVFQKALKFPANLGQSIEENHPLFLMDKGFALILLLLNFCDCCEV